jgi:5-methyltetrahydropteroyltriglutamate--homocysteine methyltransferase
MPNNQDTHSPYRAEHIGSLLRPKNLTRAFGQFSSGEISEEEFHSIQDSAIGDVVELQKSIGLKFVTDGEFRRASYWAHWIDAIDGLGVAPALFKFHDEKGTEHEFIAADCNGKLDKTGPISTEEFKFLKTISDQPVKITLPSPSTLHFWRLNETIKGSGYDSDEEYLQDLCGIYKQEISELADLSCNYVQLDEVPLIMLANEGIRNQIRSFGYDPDDLIDLYIQAMNLAIADRPNGMIAGMHICRGNFKGNWLTEGGYDVVAERVFGQIDVDAFYLEFDSERAGGFEPLQYVPAGKKVVLGLVSSKVPELEDPQTIIARIEEASGYISRENLSLSPQCGFASAVSGNPVTLDDEIRKLQLVVDIADEIWNK